MSLSSTCILDVRNGGSDTLNGGLFNPGATLNSDLAATSATGSSPVVTSATYNFVAGDVGHWLFIKSGSNWTPGWYQITSVAANAATLTAGVGTAVLYTSPYPSGSNTVAGCATTASPTSGSWAIDYSQKTAVAFSLTGLTTAASNAIILTAAATVAMVGNGIQITGGTNFTVGFYQINSVSAGVSLTVDRTCTTAAGVAGTAGLGGALTTIGIAGSIYVGTQLVMLKYNAAAFVTSVTTANVAGGVFSLGATANCLIYGYDTNRHVNNIDANQPTIQAQAGLAACTLLASNSTSILWNLIIDTNSNTGVIPQSKFTSILVTYKNLVSAPSNPVSFFFCYFTGCTVASLCVGPSYYCRVDTCTCSVGAFTSGASFCIASNITGIGFAPGGSGTIVQNCVAWTCSSHGFNSNGGVSSAAQFLNCIAVLCGGFGIVKTASNFMKTLFNCAGYSNTSGNVSGTGTEVGFITLTGDPFVNGASGNFALNNTSGAGALLRGLGFPATFPNGTPTNYADVGAVQHRDSPPILNSPPNLFITEENWF